METEKNLAVAGAFVVILTIAIVIAITWLSSGFSLTGYSTYQVDMQESVSGLSVDAVVEFNGVSVGRVKSISINHQNPRLVTLLLSVQSTTPVTEGTRAMLNVRGLTGISYIALKDRGENLQPLQAAKSHPWPLIPTEPSLFLQMDAALGKLNESVSAATQSIRALLNNENLRQISEILKNMNTLSTGLVRDDARIADILENTAVASQSLPGLISSLNHTVNNFSALTDEVRLNPAVLVRGRTQRPPGPGEE